MRILISADAENDLIAGARLYDSLEHGLGAYFIDSLLSDIDALHSYASIHVKVLGYYRDYCHTGSHTPSTIRWTTMF